MSIEKSVRILRHSNGNGSILFDSRHYPLIITGWKGDMTNELVELYWAARAPLTSQADQDGLKVIIIVDASEMNVPPATVRKYIAERGTEIDSKLRCMHRYISIIPSTIMRGVATAIAWMTGEKGVPNLVRADLESGITTAMKEFEPLGQVAPKVDRNYQLQWTE